VFTLQLLISTFLLFVLCST